MITVALYNLVLWRDAHRDTIDFKLVNTVHDSILFEVPIKYVQELIEHVVPLCMTHSALIPGIGVGLDVETKLYLHWGEDPDPEQLIHLGVPKHLVVHN